MPLQPRHEYAAGFPRGLPADDANRPRSSPHHHDARVRCCPAQICQISSWWILLRSVQPLVSHVHLPVSLAGPGPSDSAGPSRRCRGCLPPIPVDGYGWQAAPTTTGRASTVRWSGSGKRDGKVYVRNQRLNAPQENPPARNLADLGWAAAHTRIMVVRGTSGPISVVGREATRKACGVLVARLQGHSWSPNPTNGLRVNVGTIPAAPHRPA